MKRKNAGISILEILLALVLIATITTMAIRYFTVTNRSMHVSNAIKQIKHLTHISYEWLQQQNQVDFNSASNPINLKKLTDAQLIQDDPSEQYNPWGGNIRVSPGSIPSYVSISFDNVPPDACRMLVRQLKSINHIKQTPCGTAYNNTFTGEF
jgi:hypothetical protein